MKQKVMKRQRETAIPKMGISTASFGKKTWRFRQTDTREDGNRTRKSKDTTTVRQERSGGGLDVQKSR